MIRRLLTSLAHLCRLGSRREVAGLRRHLDRMLVINAALQRQNATLCEELVDANDLIDWYEDRESLDAGPVRAGDVTAYGQNYLFQ